MARPEVAPDRPEAPPFPLGRRARAHIMSASAAPASAAASGPVDGAAAGDNNDVELVDVEKLLYQQAVRLAEAHLPKAASRKSQKPGEERNPDLLPSVNIFLPAGAAAAAANSATNFKTAALSFFR